jgi:hypothetical protein
VQPHPRQELSPDGERLDSFRVGATVNGIACPVPWGELHIWRDRAVLEVAFARTVVIMRSEVTSLSWHWSPPLTRALRFETREHRLRYVSIQFKRSDAARFLRDLQAFGWSTEL